MRNWHTAPIEQRCGRCQATVYKHQPFLALKLPGLKLAKLRCVQCAGEEPHDVDATELYPALAFRPPPLFTKGYDGKMRGAEPGEDG